MYYFLYLLYAGIGYFILSKSSLRKATGLSNRVFTGLYFLKLMTALAVSYLFFYYLPANDYLVFNRHGWEEFQLLKSDPLEFLFNINDSLYEQKYGNFFSTQGSFWNDLRNNLIIKLLAIFNIISNGNFFINNLLFSLFTFCGQMALYNFLKAVLVTHKNIALISTFFLPSTVIFISCIHKDGIIFTALAFYGWAMYAIAQNNFSIKKFLVLLISFFCLLIIRNYVALIVLLVSIGFILSLKIKAKPILVMCGWLLLMVFTLFVSEKIYPNFKPLELVVKKQAAFLALPPSNTQLKTDTLLPNLNHFIQKAPAAIGRTVAHPYPTTPTSASYLFFALENMGYLLLFMLCLVLYKRRPPLPTLPAAAKAFAIFTSLLLFLFIGYVIPNSGAIIRYKSIYLPYLISFILAGINWHYLAKIFNIKFKNI